MNKPVLRKQICLEAIQLPVCSARFLVGTAI